MEVIKIDGAMGEGGGQVLRTSLTLAMLNQVAVEIVNIRAGRKKPGLLRQHLTCVRAAASISGAKVEGAELGSSRVLFIPGKVRAGDYQFAVGTAGSTSLVCQTILLPLALAGGESHITFEGGTHNGQAPSVTFLQQSFLPLMAQMGLKTELKLERFGFYPAGGGRWSLRVFPTDKLKPLRLIEEGGQPAELASKVYVTAIISKLRESVAEREIQTVIQKLGEQPLSNKVLKVASPGAGNLLSIRYNQGQHNSVFEVVGEQGISAENVAKRAVGKLNKFIHSSAVVEEYLADQLLLPIWVAGDGGYSTVKPSQHTLTNIAVIKQISGKQIKCDRHRDNYWCIEIT